MGAELFTLFEEEQTQNDKQQNGIIINYGESVDIIPKQIDRQINSDLLWAVLSVGLAAGMLRIGSGSWFMTFAGIFQLIVRCFKILPLQLAGMFSS